jgi:hypothetical protein
MGRRIPRRVTDTMADKASSASLDASSRKQHPLVAAWQVRFSVQWAQLVAQPVRTAARRICFAAWQAWSSIQRECLATVWVSHHEWRQTPVSIFLSVLGIAATFIAIFVTRSITYNAVWSQLQGEEKQFQGQRETAIQTKIKMMRLETDYNYTNAKQLWATYNSEDASKVNVGGLSDVSAQYVLADEYASDYLNESQLIIILGYIKSISVLNSSNEIYIGYNSMQRTKIREDVKRHVAQYFAYDSLIKSECSSISGEGDGIGIREINRRINETIDKIMSGEMQIR